MIKNIVLDNGNVIQYVNNIKEYKPQFIGKNSMYELSDSYNPNDLFLTFLKFEYVKRDVTVFNQLTPIHQEFWEFQCQFLVFTKNIVTMEG